MQIDILHLNSIYKCWESLKPVHLEGKIFLFLLILVKSYNFSSFYPHNNSTTLFLVRLQGHTRMPRMPFRYVHESMDVIGNAKEILQKCGHIYAYYNSQTCSEMKQLWFNTNTNVVMLGEELLWTSIYSLL